MLRAMTRPVLKSVTTDIVGSDVEGFDPLSLLWNAYWDASQTSTITDTGGLVDQIDDISNNGAVRNLTATGAQRPSTGTRTENGLNTLDFDGLANIMKSAVFTDESQPRVVVLVLREDAVNQYKFDGGSAARRSGLGSTATNPFMHGGASLISTDAIDLDLHIWEAEFNGVSSRLLRDGVEIASGNADSDVVAQYVLGARYTDSNFMNGAFCEGGVRNSLLTAGERSALNSFYQSKWFPVDIWGGFSGDVDVVVIAGQSNADGRGENTNLSSTLETFYNTTDSDLLIYNKPASRVGSTVSAGSFANDGEVFNISDVFNQTNRVTHQTIDSSNNETGTNIRHGVELSFGYQYSQNQSGRKLLVIKAAVGGSKIEDNWKVTNADSDGLWSWFKDYLWTPAIASANQNGRTINFKGVFWMQGESDTDNSTDANAYEARLQTLVNRFNNDLSHSPDKIVIGQLSDHYDNTDGTTVKTAQATVAAANANCVLLPTDGTGVYPEYTKKADDIHYNASGLEDMAGDIYSLIF